MKISKSKQELARIISENGGWRDGEFAAQDDDGEVGGYSKKPKWSTVGKYWYEGTIDGWFVNAKVANHHQTILSSAEYFHLYPAPDADGWIECGVGGIPVGFGTLVDVKLRGGNVELGQQFTFSDSWGNHGVALDIIAYRLHRPEQAKPQFCDSVMRSIPEPEINSKNINITQVDDIDVVELKPTIEQLAADYRSAKYYADRKQQEADAAKDDADEKLRVLELAGEAIGLIVSPITDKQEPEREWEVHDRCVVVDSPGGLDWEGCECTLVRIDGSDKELPYRVQDDESDTYWVHSIRRP